jgi:hypothetical protein
MDCIILDAYGRKHPVGAVQQALCKVCVHNRCKRTLHRCKHTSLHISNWHYLFLNVSNNSHGRITLGRYHSLEIKVLFGIHSRQYSVLSNIGCRSFLNIEDNLNKTASCNYFCHYRFRHHCCYRNTLRFCFFAEVCWTFSFSSRSHIC